MHCGNVSDAIIGLYTAAVLVMHCCVGALIRSGIAGIAGYYIPMSLIADKEFVSGGKISRLL